MNWLKASDASLSSGLLRSRDAKNSSVCFQCLVETHLALQCRRLSLLATQCSFAVVVRICARRHILGLLCCGARMVWKHVCVGYLRFRWHHHRLRLVVGFLIVPAKPCRATTMVLKHVCAASLRRRWHHQRLRLVV